MQRDQRAAEARAHVRHVVRLELRAELAREAVGLVFEPPGDGVESHADDRLERGEDHLQADGVSRGGEGEGRILAWKRRKAMIGGGLAATSAGKPNERRRGGAWRKAGNRARMEKMWI